MIFETLEDVKKEVETMVRCGIVPDNVRIIQEIPFEVKVE